MPIYFCLRFKNIYFPSSNNPAELIPLPVTYTRKLTLSIRKILQTAHRVAQKSVDFALIQLRTRNFNSFSRVHLLLLLLLLPENYKSSTALIESTIWQLLLLLIQSLFLLVFFCCSTINHSGVVHKNAVKWKFSAQNIANFHRTLCCFERCGLD